MKTLPSSSLNTSTHITSALSPHPGLLRGPGLSAGADKLEKSKYQRSEGNHLTGPAGPAITFPMLTSPAAGGWGHQCASCPLLILCQGFPVHWEWHRPDPPSITSHAPRQRHQAELCVPQHVGPQHSFCANEGCCDSYCLINVIEASGLPWNYYVELVMGVMELVMGISGS